jgi:hypothetical protein
VELVVKFLPADRSQAGGADHIVRIGIRFIYEYLAVKPYETIISRHGTDNFSVRLELERGAIKLVLRSDDGGKFEYKELAFRSEHVKKLKDLLERERVPIQFVHVYPKENRLFIAKPFKKERFVNVTGVDFIGMDN